MTTVSAQRSTDSASFASSGSSHARQQRPSFTSKDSANRPGQKSAKTQHEQEDAYFTELLSYSLERLGKEPELLRADQEHLKRRAEESAIKHYKAFINTASCLEAARIEMQGLAGHVDALLEEIPVLDRVCSEFTTTAKDLQAKQAENKHLQSTRCQTCNLVDNRHSICQMACMQKQGSLYICLQLCHNFWECCSRCMS